MQLETIPLSSVQIIDRERLELGDMDGLMSSLITWGQKMPILLRRSDMRLIDGGRRCEAAKRLEWPIIHAVFAEEVTDDELKALEVEVNEQRKAMTWQEKVMAIRKIHLMRATSAAIRSENWSYEMTGRLMGVQLAQVSYALRIAAALSSSPEHPVWKAGTVNEALNILIKEQEDAATKRLNQITAAAAGVINKGVTGLQSLSTPQLAADTQAGPVVAGQSYVSPDPTIDDLGDSSEDGPEPVILTPSNFEAVTTPTAPTEAIRPLIPLSDMFFNMDAKQFLPLLANESVDHFITDPPYGIDMDMLEQGNTGMDDINRVRETHGVEDNLDLLQFFIKESYRALRPNGWTIFWYDLDHHEKLQTWAKQAGYSPMRWPFVWLKVHPCLNQQPSKNWTKATEQAMVLRKGNATLVTNQPQNFIAADGRVDRARYKNPFAKPAQVWQSLMTAVALRGQIICDPFAGEMSGPLAAISLGMRPLACEIEEHHYNSGMDHIRRTYMNMIDNVEFR